MREKKPSVEGRFYPDTKKKIFDFITSYFDDSIKINSRIIVVPHAGYLFSGSVSAKTFSYLNKKFKTAIILGTAHTIYTSKCITLSNTLFKNCIGDVSTDDDLIDELIKTKLFEENPNAFETEHSVEVQIPFLQYINKDFKIVPLIVGSGNSNYLKQAASVIASIMKKRKDVVLVISSDLSHYPPYEVAYVVDNAMGLSYKASSINRNADYFLLTRDLLEEKYRKKLDTVACGFSPMYVGLATAIELGLKFDIVNYLNSGDVSEEFRDEVVGYLGGFFIENDGCDWRFNLSSDESEFLIHLAKTSIESYLKYKKNFRIDYIQYPKLNLPCAVFVTLNIDDELRGCIGSMTPHMLMSDAVCEYAIKAAFEDPRFPPLSEDEFKKISIEISLLSPLIKIDDISEIKEGVHGVYVKRGILSGTYLPQVWEHFSNKQDFLKSLLNEKSGIGYHHLSDPKTEIYIYNVEKIKS